MFERCLYKVVASGNASTNPGDNTSQKRKGSRHRRGNAALSGESKVGWLAGFLVSFCPCQVSPTEPQQGSDKDHSQVCYRLLLLALPSHPTQLSERTAVVLVFY